MPNQLNIDEITVEICTDRHLFFVTEIANLICSANKEPGTAIALRSEDEIRSKILAGVAVIATKKSLPSKVIGFVFVSPWQNDTFVSTSGLVVDPDYRGIGIGKALKLASVDLIKEKFPDATAFGITLSSAVMKMNSECGFIPTSYKKITSDPKFWAGCSTCPYYSTLIQMERNRCFCTAMILKDVSTLNE